MTAGQKLMADAKFYESYARYIESEQRYETWDEAVHRVMDMHRTKYLDKMTPELSTLLDFVEDAYKKKEILGAQRALQFGGEQLLRNNAKMFNCTATYCDRVEVFKELFWLMLCGCGVGFSVQKEHIDKLPAISPRGEDVISFKPEDSIEGWADCVDVLVKSFFDIDSEYKGKKIYFDLSEIRPKGALISGGFKAPGPEPLRLALQKIEELLIAETAKDTVKMRPIVAYDIVMHVADAVISGGVRRAASICLFSVDDMEMINAKTGDWFVTNKQRGRSNNSAVLLRDGTTFETFNKIMESVKHSGEPGFVFSDDLDVLFNPCFHKDTRLHTNKGLIRIEDLYKSKEENLVIIDNRAGKGNELDLSNYGTSVKEASAVKLTQKNADIYEVRLNNGSVIRTTLNHEFPTIRGRLKLKDLQVGDTLLLQSEEGKWGNKGNYNLGLILGLITGDGTFTNNEAFIDLWEDDLQQSDEIRDIVNEEIAKVANKTSRDYVELNWYKQPSKYNNVPKKRIGGVRLFRLLQKNLDILNPIDIKLNIPECIWQGTREMVIGYLHGLFFSDGAITYAEYKTKATLSLRLNKSNEQLLQEVQELLQNFGISSKIYSREKESYRSLPDGKGGFKEYLCKENFELIVNRPNLIRFMDTVSLYGSKKDIALTLLDKKGYSCNKKEKFLAKIVSIDFYGNEDVYCLYQEETNTVIANGIVAGQCVEIGMYGYTSDGRSGFQACNLTEINGALSNSDEIFLRQCKAASILGTLQAGYTDFKYVSSATKEILEREALIGVGITGWMNNPKYLFNKDNQKKGAEEVKKWNKIVAEMIGIKQAARTTCVKPSGNASVLLGCASGIHGEHAPRYIRHVQMNKDTEVGQTITKLNPQMVETSVWNERDYVIGFPVEPIEGSIYKSDLLGIKQLEYVKNAQENWIEYGTNYDLCVKPFLRHNVSNTITVDDWDEVAKYIYDNRYSLCGISLLSAAGDRAYPQAPFTQIYTAEQIFDTYGQPAIFTSALIEAGLKAFNDDLWTAIATAMGEGEQLTEEHTDLLKRDFVRRFNKFSSEFESKEECGNCLKDVYNLHKWWKINKLMKPMEWIKMLPKKKYVDINTLGSQACSGGACEVEF